MQIRDIIERNGEFPIFVRGTFVEEAVWLLGKNRNKYRSRPHKIYAFPIYEGFSNMGITPIKPIPKDYTLIKMRDEVLISSEKDSGSSLFCFGDEGHEDIFREDDERIGVAIYFSPKIINLGYEQDCDVKDRLEQLCAVKIQIPDDFNPEYIFMVESFGPSDFTILNMNFPKNEIFTDPRFRNRDDLHSYCSQHIDNITFTKNGFTFP